MDEGSDQQPVPASASSVAGSGVVVDGGGPAIHSVPVLVAVYTGGDQRGELPG